MSALRSQFNKIFPLNFTIPPCDNKYVLHNTPKNKCFIPLLFICIVLVISCETNKPRLSSQDKNVLAKNEQQTDTSIDTKALVLEAIKIIDGNNTHMLDSYFSENAMIQIGSKKYGREKVSQVSRDAQTKKITRIIDKVIEDNGKIGVHSKRIINNQTFLVADFFTIDNELISEYWQFQQIEVAKEDSISGFDMLFPEKIVEAKGNNHKSKNLNIMEQGLIEEKNKKLVRNFMEYALSQGDVYYAKQVLKDNYIQHNPRIATGKKPMIEFISNAKQIPNEIRDIIADGDLVWVYASYPSFNTEVVDIFRVENFLIAEHWDILNDKSNVLNNDVLWVQER